MAWTAKVTKITPRQDNFDVSVDYYDSADTEFTTVLGSQTVTLPATVTQSEATAAIKNAGTGFRKAHNLIATYTGATVNIP